jgi:hypothetical protein
MLRAHSTSPPTIPTFGQAKVFVLACIDPRFTYFLNWFLNYQSSLNNKYDLFVLAGASIGVHQGITLVNANASLDFPNSRDLSTRPVFDHWPKTFLDNLRIGIVLHGITDVWVFDHSQCGAFRAFLDIDAPAWETDLDHENSINDLYTYLQTNPAGDALLDAGGDLPVNAIDVSKLNFKGFLIDLNGQISVVKEEYPNSGALGPTINVDLNFSIEKANEYWRLVAFLLGLTIVFILFLKLKK